MDDYMMKNRKVARSLTKAWMITGRQKKAKEAEEAGKEGRLRLPRPVHEEQSE
jgi:hypothetical protein